MTSDLFGEEHQADKRRAAGAHERPGGGATNEWYTPRHIFDAIGLEFDLDPASPIDGPVPWVPARRFLTALDNGLLTQWEGRVWLNPPYGRDVGRWVGKLAEHDDGIALVFARTETPWFQDYAPRASAIVFPRGRLTFVDGSHRRGKGNAGAPSALLAYGRVCGDALAQSALGWVVRPGQA